MVGFDSIGYLDSALIDSGAWLAFKGKSVHWMLKMFVYRTVQKHLVPSVMRSRFVNPCNHRPF